MPISMIRPRGRPTDPTVIFVHGFRSSAETCWSHANGKSWPEIAKADPELGSCGIATISYRTALNSPRYSVTDAAAELYECLQDERLVGDQSPLLFVGHSMGGIVTRKMLLAEQERLAPVPAIGLLLVASPSRGSSWASFLRPLARLLGHAQALALVCSEGNHWLNDLSHDFKRWRESNSIKIVGRELLEERLVLAPWLHWLPPIVKRSEGDVFFAESLLIAGSDHFSIAKPESEKSRQHQSLRRLMQTLCERAGGIVFAVPAGASFGTAVSMVERIYADEVSEVRVAGFSDDELSCETIRDREIRSTTPCGLLDALHSCFPAGAIRPYASEMHGRTITLSVS